MLELILDYHSKHSTVKDLSAKKQKQPKKPRLILTLFGFVFMQESAPIILYIFFL